MVKRLLYTGASDVQATWAGCNDPRGILEEGVEYEVEYEDVHNWHTRIKLVVIDGEFNSTCFVTTIREKVRQAVEEIEEERCVSKT